MNPIRTGILKDKLEKRRNQVIVTLRHLEKEQKEVEEYNDWLDHATRESRVRLMETLTDWYLKEAARIDKALGRMDAHIYGVCHACHHPIEERRLRTFPESEFCIGCQEMRETFERV